MIGRTLVAIGSVGIFIFVVGLMAVEPLIAFIGFFIMLPLILTYIIVFLLPEYWSYIEEKRKPPSFDFPNHSVTHNISGPEEDKNTSWGTRDVEEQVSKGKGNFDTTYREQQERINSSQSTSKTKRPTTPQSAEISAAEKSLDLEKPYTKKELSRTYKEKVKLTHPDTEDGSQKQFIEIQEAYELLLEEESYMD